MRLRATPPIVCDCVAPAAVAVRVVVVVVVVVVDRDIGLHRVGSFRSSTDRPTPTAGRRGEKSNSVEINFGRAGRLPRAAHVGLDGAFGRGGARAFWSARDRRANESAGTDAGRERFITSRRH